MPAQTRGFLFSDLRGYSAFTERHGDRAARNLLAAYRRIVREAIARFGGAEIRTEGDSFYVVFSSVSEAVEAGLAIVDGLRSQTDADHPIRAGIGIHAGEVEDSAEGIVSTAVNIAARICAAAAPGEVLVSDTVRSLTRGYLEVRFIPLGRRRLKGIAERMPLYRVVAGATAADAPTGVRAVRGPRRVMLAAAAVLVVAVSAVVGGTLLRESFAGVGGGGGEAASSAADLATPSQPASSALASVSATPVAFPNEDELTLLELVDEAYRPTCERAAPDSLPPLQGPGEPARGPYGGGAHSGPYITDVWFWAGITCSPFAVDAPDELTYWAMSEAAAPVSIATNAQAWIANRAGWLDIPPGTCETDRRAYEQWEAGPLSGLLVCFSSVEIGSTIYWTYEGSDVIGRAIRTDGDLDALLEWWREDARYRRP